MYVLYIFYLRVCCAKTRCCVEPPPSMAVLIRWGLIFSQQRHIVKQPLRKPFEIDGVDTRNKAKSTAGTPKNEHPCSFLGCQFAEANWLLLETTAIRGGSDTLSIYCRSGTDAAGLNRSDISALPKFAIKSVHGCTLLMMRRSRCTVYFKRNRGVWFLRSYPSPPPPRQITTYRRILPSALRAFW